MYNSSQKLKFISEITTSSSVAKGYENLFNRIAVMEEKCGTDISDMSDAQISDVIFSLTAANPSTTQAYITLIMSYLKWSNSNGVSDFISSNISDIAVINKIKSSFVSSPSALVDRLGEFFNDDDDMTQDIVYKCYFWLAFMRVPQEVAITITNDNVDIDSKTVTIAGYKYKIPDEALQTFTLCKECTKFQTNRFSHVKILYRTEDNYFLRTSTGRIDGLRCVVSGVIDKRRKKRNIKSSMSYKSIYFSGVFYYAYLDEINGIPVDFSFIAKTLSRTGNQSKVTIASANSRYKREYRAWKQAFNLKIE